MRSELTIVAQVIYIFQPWRYCWFHEVGRGRPGRFDSESVPSGDYIVVSRICALPINDFTSSHVLHLGY